MGNRHPSSRKRDKKQPSKQKTEIIAKYCYQYKSLEEQILLLNGYVHEYYNGDQMIPNDIIQILITMIGKFIKNRFEWFINGTDLKKMLLNPNDMNITLENNEFNVYGLKPFKLNVYTNTADAVLRVSLKSPQPYFDLCDIPLAPSRYGRKYEYFATLFIEELNYKVIDHTSSGLRIPFSTISGLSSLRLSIVIDINYIITKFNPASKQAVVYYNNCFKRKMLTNWNVNWTLNNKLMPSYRYGLQKDPFKYRDSFYSETIDDSHWVMRLDHIINYENENEDKLRLNLQLLQWPFGFYEELKISVNIKLTINTKCETKDMEIDFCERTENELLQVKCIKYFDKRCDFSMESMNIQLNVQISNVQISNIPSIPICSKNDKNDVMIKKRSSDLRWSWDPVWSRDNLDRECSETYDQIFDNWCLLNVTETGKIDWTERKRS